MPLRTYFKLAEAARLSQSWSTTCFSLAVTCISTEFPTELDSRCPRLPVDFPVDAFDAITNA